MHAVFQTAILKSNPCIFEISLIFWKLWENFVAPAGHDIFWFSIKFWYQLHMLKIQYLCRLTNLTTSVTKYFQHSYQCCFFFQSPHLSEGLLSLCLQGKHSAVLQKHNSDVLIFYNIAQNVSNGPPLHHISVIHDTKKLRYSFSQSWFCITPETWGCIEKPCLEILLWRQWWTDCMDRNDCILWCLKS